MERRSKLRPSLCCWTSISFWLSAFSSTPIPNSCFLSEKKNTRIVRLYQLRTVWQKIILKGDMIRPDLMSSIMDLWRFSVFSACQPAPLLPLKSGISDFSSASLLTSDVSPLGSNSYSSSSSSSSVGTRSSSPLTGRKHSVKYNTHKYDIIRVQNQYRAYL